MVAVSRATAITLDGVVAQGRQGRWCFAGRGSLRSSAVGSRADLDGEQLFCYSSSMRSKLANGVFAE